MRFAIDAMGGDRAPEAPIKGALLALSAFDDVHVVLVGDPTTIEPILDGLEIAPDVAKRLRVHDAPDQITCFDDQVRAIRKNPRLSARAVADLLNDGEVDGVITMGSTGAAVAAATLRCRRLRGVRRLGIAVPLPRLGGVTITVDAGANPDSRPEDLHQYAVMAYHYVEHALGVKKPRIGILSIGEERTKGNRLIQDTWALIDKHPIKGFVGNIEPREIFLDRVDVVICDGFVGNIVLKTAEGMGEFAMKVIQESVGKEHPEIARTAIDALGDRIDYSKFGGGPLLGLEAGYLIGHGRSGPEAYVSAVTTLRRFVEGHVIDHIRDSLSPVGQGSSPEDAG